MADNVVAKKKLAGDKVKKFVHTPKADAKLDETDE